MKHFYCQAILFDLDGVLVNSIASDEMHWRRWATKHSLDVEAILQVSHGRPTVETIRLVAPHLPAEEEARRLIEQVTTDFTGMVAIAGAAELLEAIAPERWAIVTSGSLAIAPGRLRYVGLPMPDVLITADDVSRGKPDPEGYLKAAARLGFTPEDCLVIEDSIAGIQAARAAGMRVIATTTTYPIDAFTNADACISSLASITISRLESGDSGMCLEITV